MMEMDVREGGVCGTAADAAASARLRDAGRPAAECSVAQAIELISRCAQATPLRTVHSEAGTGLAMWRFMPGRIALDPLPCNVLSYLRHGTPTITRITGGRYARKRLRTGAVTFLPQGVASEWLLEGAATCLHVYIPGSALAIDDFFGIEDAWLGTYFQMLVSEYDTFWAQQAPADSLLVDETQRSLLRHLARWHSAAATAKPGARERSGKVSPLRPSMLQRISDFIDANLAADISLRALAELSAMSVEHFLRSFRAATGKTPYQYVLELRLAKAALLLKSDPAPVSAIAPECGFRNLSHFSLRFRAHFGISPSQFRRELGAR
jgi:AraC family transcriptional regulator